MITKIFTKNQKLCILFVFIVILCWESLAYSMDAPNEVVHQYITNESVLLWTQMPNEIKEHSKNRITDQAIDSNYDFGNDMITGSGEEDLQLSTIFNLPPYGNHFFNPDDPDTLSSGDGDYNDGLLASGSSFVRAREIWMTEIIPNYIKGNINESYYHLGRVAHLLEDATQPGHVHLDPHIGHQLGICFGLNDDCDDSFLEEFTAQQGYFPDTQGKMNVENYPGENYTNKHYKYENLIEDFNWSDVDATYNNTFGSVIPLFRLFWYTSQKTQYFASDDSNGNNIYVDLEGNEHQFNPSLWDEGVAIINESSSFDGEDFYYSGEDEGETCSSQTNSTCISESLEYPCYLCNNNTGPNIESETNAVVPHAMKAVAGLYRLFWDAVHVDWATFNHNYRHTGSTLLKGDLTNLTSEITWTSSGSPTTDFWDDIVIADIDNNYTDEETGNDGMELIVATQNFDDTDGRVYALDGKTDNQLWTNNDTGTANFPTVADVYGDGNKKVLVGTTQGRKIYVINSDHGGTNWTYTANGADNFFIGAPIVADVDLDGSNEVIFSDFYYVWGSNAYVYATDSSGNLEWETLMTGGIFGPERSLAMANLDDDDYPELVVNSFYEVFVLDANNGSIKWSNASITTPIAAPVVADINNDGEYEIIVVTIGSPVNCILGFCLNKTYVLNASGGPVWEQTMDYGATATPAVANLDDDPYLEVVVVTDREPDLVNDPNKNLSNGTVYVLDGLTGDVQWTYHTAKISANPSIADIDNDGELEIIVGTFGGLVLVLNKSGGLEWSYNVSSFIDSQIAIGDLDGDGAAEMAVKHAHGIGSNANNNYGSPSLYKPMTKEEAKIWKDEKKKKRGSLIKKNKKYIAVKNHKSKLNEQTYDSLLFEEDNIKKDFVIKFKNNVKNLNKINKKKEFSNLRTALVESTIEDIINVVDDPDIEYIEINQDIYFNEEVSTNESSNVTIQFNETTEFNITVESDITNSSENSTNDSVANISPEIEDNLPIDINEGALDISPVLNAINITNENLNEPIIESILYYIKDAITYNINKTKAPYSWDKSKGDNVKIGILDTGISSHDDLEIVNGISFVSNNYNDNNGHGTAIAGIVSAVINDEGIVGVAPKADIYAVKIMEGNTGQLSDAIEGIEWAIENNIDIISMSWGLRSYSKILEEVLYKAYESDILLLASSGNDGENNVLYPAHYPQVIAVGAVDQENEKSTISNFGEELELMADGVDIYTTSNNNDYSTVSGTSFSVPHIAGIGALIKSYNTDLNSCQTREILRKSAVDLGNPGFDEEYGHGLGVADLDSIGNIDVSDIDCSIEREIIDIEEEPEGIFLLGEDSTLEVLGGINDQPSLNFISNISAIEGDLIDINSTGEIIASDEDNDTLTFYYSSPFNGTGLWQTECDSSGNYSILVEVSDGSLSDWRYVHVQVNESCPIPSISLSSIPNKQGFGENVTIIANVTREGAEIDTVMVGITPPNEQETNYTMSNLSGLWEYTFTDYSNGTYSYTVYANDSYGFANSTSDIFEMFVDFHISVRTFDNSYGKNDFVNITGLNDTLTEFNNSKTTENFTFIGNQNYTRYVELPAYVTVLSANLILTGYSNAAEVLIEEDAINESAGYVTGGAYESLYDDDEFHKSTDADFDTFGSIIRDGISGSGSLGYAYVYENYTYTEHDRIYSKIRYFSLSEQACIAHISQSCLNLSNNNWIVLFLDNSDSGHVTTSNLLPSDCLGGTEIQLRTYLYTFDPTSSSSCDTGDTMHSVYYETSILNYNFTNIVNPYLEVGTPDENYEWQVAPYTEEDDNEDSSSFAIHNDFTSVSSSFDENINSYGNYVTSSPSTSFGATIYENYNSVPSFTDKGEWEFKYYLFETGTCNDQYFSVECFNGSNWIQQFNDTDGDTYGPITQNIELDNSCYNNGALNISTTARTGTSGGGNCGVYYYEGKVIWYNDSEFTFSESTQDFSSALNNALNSSACNCDGCLIVNTFNCSIPLTFHSDTAGVLEYSSIMMDYEDSQSSLRNRETVNASIYLLMKVQYWNESDWTDQEIIMNDTSPRKVQPGLNNTVNLSSIWNPNAWNTGTHDIGIYRVWIAAVDENNVTLINVDGTEIISVYNFSIGTEENIEITSLQTLYSDNPYSIFEFIIENNETQTLNNVLWSLDTGIDGIINSTINSTLESQESRFVFVEHGSSSTEDYSITANATSGDLYSSKELNVDLINFVASFYNLSISGTTVILEAVVNNSVNESRISNVNWSLDTDDGDVINTTNLFNLQSNESIFIFTKYQYNNSGNYNPSFTATETYSDTKSLMIDV